MFLSLIVYLFEWIPYIVQDWTFEYYMKELSKEFWIKLSLDSIQQRLDLDWNVTFTKLHTTIVPSYHERIILNLYEQSWRKLILTNENKEVAFSWANFIRPRHNTANGNHQPIDHLANEINWDVFNHLFPISPRLTAKKLFFRLIYLQCLLNQTQLYLLADMQCRPFDVADNAARVGQLLHAICQEYITE
jgi:hypothetical protein